MGEKDFERRPMETEGAGGPPVGVPAGPPPSIPAGPPSGIPGGPPQGAPQGPPSGIPGGPPPGRDPITDALNMAAVGQLYGRLVATTDDPSMAIWFIDLRNFRSINPKYGYGRGNVVLRTVASVLVSDMAHDLPVGRVGGDRFLMLTSGISADEAESALTAAAAHVSAEIARVGITESVVLAAGIYYLRALDHERPDMNRALDYASIAHRSAHDSTSSNIAVFSDEDLERDMRRITIEQSIDEALAYGQIQVWYQPQVDYTLGEVVGAEALARWRHPELGWIEPTEFIPALENCGKVHALDLFVWEEACKNASRWRSFADGRPVPISVNISRAEVFEPGLMEHFLELQRKYDLPEGSLHLEITESAFSEEAERLYSVVERMRDHHLLVEMDDFGSGLSSLHMLKDVPVDVVKLDMGFIRSAVGEERGGVVLASVIRMLQGLDTPIIAEGVETLEQAEMLKNMGCHLMQGFHFSRPMPRDDFESYVATTRAVEHASRRERHESNLDELLTFDPASSYIFNHALGGMMLVVVGREASESLLVNDEFYRGCGLDRLAFGNSKVNPLEELDQESQETMWRAAAEAREHGSALCHVEVRISQRWIDCVVRFLGTSARGDIYAIIIVRSGERDGDYDLQAQRHQDAAWYVDTLNSIAPNGFVKCEAGDGLTISYVSPCLYARAGLGPDEFAQLFHNSFLECVVAEDRQMLLDTVAEGRRTGRVVSCGLRMRHGYGADRRRVQLVGRVMEDNEDRSWFYAVLLELGNGEDENDVAAPSSDSVIPFDYTVADDLLVVHMPDGDGGTHDVSIEHCLANMESFPEYIARSSAVKMLATMSDLLHHPAAGFLDIKSNLRGGPGLRWYHVDYTCDADETGTATVVHGFARGADDQRGSARWWRRQAQTDQLTGLLNRNAVEEEINVAMRTQGAGMMFMVDLDGFKRVNDELGHLVGDALLRDVAEAIEGAFREGDVIGRYGGDEFVAFMSVMNGESGAIAERRAAEIVSAVSDVCASDGTHAACSVGVAICNDREATFYDLLEVADEAMYQSKERGKGTYTIVEMGA